MPVTAGLFARFRMTSQAGRPTTENRGVGGSSPPLAMRSTSPVSGLGPTNAACQTPRNQQETKTRHWSHSRTEVSSGHDRGPRAPEQQLDAVLHHREPASICAAPANGRRPASPGSTTP
jgi:hypothetical protein